MLSTYSVAMAEPLTCKFELCLVINGFSLLDKEDVENENKQQSFNDEMLWGLLEYALNVPYNLKVSSDCVNGIIQRVRTHNKVERSLRKQF